MNRRISNFTYGLLDYAAHPIGMLVVAQVFLRNLGSAQYGIWVAAASAVNIGAVVASGFGDANIHQVATLRANGSRMEMFRIVRSTMAIHLVLGAGIAAILWSAAPYLARLLAHADSALLSICLFSMRIAAVLVLIRAVETVCISTQRGFERYGAAVGISVTARVLSLVAAAAIALYAGGVVAILAVSTGFAALALVVQLFQIRRLLQIDSLLPAFNARAVRGLLGFGVFTWSLSFTGVVFSQGDRLIGGASMGASALVAYAICAQIAQPVYGLTAAGLHFLFPYIAFRRAVDTPAALARIVIRSVLANALLVAIGTGLLLAFSRPILRMLATDSIAAACAPLIGPVLASSAILALTVSGNYALLALGRPRPPALINMVAALAMFLVIETSLPSRGTWAIVEARMAFAAIAMLIYIPLFRSISLRRVVSRSPAMQSSFAAEENA
jgi:O-antigen/teichoic acid export membrane protein